MVALYTRVSDLVPSNNIAKSAVANLPFALKSLLSSHISYSGFVEMEKCILLANLKIKIKIKK